QRESFISMFIRALTMKIKNHVAYYVPLFIFIVIATVASGTPKESRKTQLCKQYSSCVAMMPSFSGWPSLR
ncbi:hypothetical protein, partial [Pseudomonas helleri]